MGRHSMEVYQGQRPYSYRSSSTRPGSSYQDIESLYRRDAQEHDNGREGDTVPWGKYLSKDHRYYRTHIQDEVFCFNQRTCFFSSSTLQDRDYQTKVWAGTLLCQIYGKIQRVISEAIKFLSHL